MVVTNAAKHSITYRFVGTQTLNYRIITDSQLKQGYILSLMQIRFGMVNPGGHEW
jgi:hypothetical protein